MLHYDSVVTEAKALEGLNGPKIWRYYKEKKPRGREMTKSQLEREATE
jgi:hypothetical protein